MMAQENAAYKDEITGLGNKAAYLRDIENIFAGPEDERRGLFLAVTDLDGFKKVNDTHGHLTGDYMIKEFADILVNNLKELETDISHFGGDEFVIIFKKQGKKQVLAACEAIRQEVYDREFQIPKERRKARVSTSIGVAGYPDDGKTKDDLFNRADEALYSSKHLKGNRVSLAKDTVPLVKEDKRVHKSLLRPKLTGRDEELKQVRSSLFSENPNKLSLLNAGIGIGKTRLLEEISIIAKQEKAESFLIACTETHRQKPYSAIVDILVLLSKKYPKLYQKAFDSLDPKNKQALLCIPRLRILVDQKSQQKASSPDTRLNLFYGKCSLMSFLIKELKPIFLIDNIDLIDEGSVEIISYLIASERTLPARICGTKNREDSIEDDSRSLSFLNKLVNRLSEFEIISVIDVELFSKNQTNQFIRNIFLKTEIPDSFFDHMHKVTRGNPFFITEILRDFLDRRIIYLEYPKWLFKAKQKDFPENLAQLLMHKLDRLEREEKEILLAAAGFGRSFRFDFLTKLRKINVSYVQDIITKAVNQNIFHAEELQATESLSFSNEMFRRILYESADNNKKKKLHLEIAETIKDANKNDLDSVSPELAFHFDKAKVEAKSNEYAQLAVKYADKLFSDEKVDKLIDDVVKEREEKEKLEPIKKESWPLVLQIITTFNSAVRNIFVYNRPNVITDRAINRLVGIFKEFFKPQNSITISTPVDAPKDVQKLLINGRTFHISSSAERVAASNIIETMRNFNIGSITFKNTVLYGELNNFVNLFQKSVVHKEAKEYWSGLLSDNKIFGIKIDQVLYKRIHAGDEKSQYRSTMIKDAIATEDILKEAVKGIKGQATSSSPEAGLAPEKTTKKQKNVFEKALTKMPSELIIETIAEEYKNRKNNILDIKDMVLVCLKYSEERKKLLPLILSQLGKLGLSKECFDWLIDEKDFSEYPVKKKANIYLNTDIKTTIEMEALDTLLPTLKELLASSENMTVGSILEKYFLKSQESKDQRLKLYFARTLPELIELLPENIFEAYFPKITEIFITALESEKDETTLKILINDVVHVLNKLVEARDYVSIEKMLSALKDEVRNEIDTLFVCNELLKELDSSSLDSSTENMVQNILRLLLPSSIPFLFDFLLSRYSRTVQFESYLLERNIINMLRDYKEESKQIIESLLNSKRGKEEVIQRIKNQILK